MFVIYHNPKCSKSRKALELLEQSGENFKITEYLNNQLNIEEILNIQKQLNLNFQEFMRTKDDLFNELELNGKNLSQNDWAEILSNHPALLERPIISNGYKAIIARPPELVLEFINKSKK